MSVITPSCIFLLVLLPLTFSQVLPDRFFRLKKSESSDFNTSGYRLPSSLEPTRYNLTLLPFLNNSTFKGWVNITFNVLEETDRVIINTNFNYIKLPTITASIVAAVTVSVKNFTADETHEQLIIQLTDKLAVQNDVNISISYEGILATDMHGFYLSTYNTSDANHSMAITQFESTDARRAFPCFDEPAYRATFSVNIYRLANQTSLANMPLDSSTVDNTIGFILDSYQLTPPMPTYLVAFGVSDLPNVTDNGTFRVFVRESIKSDTAYLVSVGQSILNNISSFLGVPYPLPKMDVVGVPDFSAGAMENWGLTTYREKYVQYNAARNSWMDKFNVLSVVTHEFGHQWFGDLVTPQWWDYAWLNEAFATYFEYTMPDIMEPSWAIGSSMFVSGAVQPALSEDTGDPRPITSPVSTPDQIEDLFDYVIYEKGGSVLRMTENFLTTPVWRAGLNKYLTANANGLGTPNKLFSALQEAATVIGLTNVNETLQGWTTQPGYPLVTVNLVNATNGGGSLYNITQTPYDLKANFSNLTWNIPLTYTSQSQQVFDASKATKTWLLPSNPNTSLVAVNDSGWVIFNVDQIGFFRVNYDKNNWEKLRAQLSSNLSAISSTNRGQLMEDAFHLARTGQLDYTTALALPRYLPAETALVPWNTFFKNMRFLIAQFYGTPTGDGLKKYAQNIMARPFQVMSANLGQVVSSFQGSATLQLASQFSCDVGLPDCLSLGNRVFEAWRIDANTVIMPEVKQAVMCSGLQQDTSKQAALDVLNSFLNSDNAAEKLTLLNALGCVSNEEAINIFLNVVCDANANHVRLQDRWIAFRALLSRQTGITPGLQYIVNNFNQVSDALGSDLSKVISAVARTIIQQQHISQVQNLVNNATVDQRLRELLNSTVLPIVKNRQAWIASQQGSDLKAWVDSYVKSSATSVIVNLLLVCTALSLVKFFN